MSNYNQHNREGLHCSRTGSFRASYNGLPGQTTQDGRGLIQRVFRNMSSLVDLNHHLCLTLTEMIDSEKMALLDDPVSSQCLFGDTVGMFSERFLEAQKQSKAMSHFLHRHTGAHMFHTQLGMDSGFLPQSGEPF